MPSAPPERTCVGCRGRRAKDGLIRVVRGPEGVRVDPRGSGSGRGAYVHPDRDCIDRALASDAIARALRTRLGEDEAVRLRRDLEGVMGAT